MLMLGQPSLVQRLQCALRIPHRRRAALVALLATELAIAIRFLGW
jgi:hypothetical protein